MPRITRAALRSRETQEESSVAAAVPLPLTPIKGRVPLGETTGNSGSGISNEAEESVGAAKKVSRKGKKGKAAPKVTNEAVARTAAHSVEILEDDNQSTASSAADEASESLHNKAPDHKAVFHDNMPSTPSAAVSAASQQLSPKSAPQDLGPEVHSLEIQTKVDAETDQDIPIAASIESQAPAAKSEPEASKSETPSNGEQEILSVRHTSRSPKRRIEDSVAALDALEEEIERVECLIPEVTEIQSTMKTKNQKSHGAKPYSSKKVEKNTTLDKRSKPVVERTTVKAGKPRSSMPPPPIIKARTNTVHPLDQSRQSIALESATSTEKSRSQSGHKRQVSSIHKAPFQPTKSLKAPTKPDFELPGEAVARKLKEQKEERSKREEETPKKPAFKARPNPLRQSQAPEVKLTAATKARLSLAKGEIIARTSSTNRITGPQTLAPTRPHISTNANKRMSSLSVAKRTNAPPVANSSAPRAPSVTASAAHRTSSILNVPPTSDDLAQQKIKGKEVFGRAKAEIQDRERARKEKEEAAKKARADAAERGRVASREWAKKQKLRNLEAQKGKNSGDVKDG